MTSTEYQLLYVTQFDGFLDTLLSIMKPSMPKRRNTAQSPEKADSKQTAMMRMPKLEATIDEPKTHPLVRLSTSGLALRDKSYKIMARYLARSPE